jgi:transaldolase
MTPTALQLLAEYGQSPWLDALSRALLAGGDLERLVRAHGIRGVTSNVPLLAEAVRSGGHYDAQIQALAEHDPETIARALTITDVKDACELMRPVWQDSGGADGHVSLAVDPRLATDSERTREQAELLRELVGRPNLMIEIVATASGVLAVEDSIARAISVYATPICSLERYREVAKAYRRGIERLLESGGDPASVAAVAGVCVARIDAEADRRLEIQGGDARRLRGRLAIASAKLIHEQHRQTFGSPRWRALEARGARPLRCLWSSEPPRDYPRLLYVEELIGAETVCAMSIETVEAFERDGVLADKLERGLDDARRAVHDIQAAGVDLADVATTLEGQGVRTLVDDFEALLEAVSLRRSAARRRNGRRGR